MTSIHRHQTPPRYRHVIHRRCCTVQHPPFDVAPYTANATLSIKPEAHNIVQRRRSRTEPRPQGICTQNFVRIGPAVLEIWSRTDRRTDRRVEHNTPHTYWGGVIKRYSDAILYSSLCRSMIYLFTTFPFKRVQWQMLFLQHRRQTVL